MILSADIYTPNVSLTPEAANPEAPQTSSGIDWMKYNQQTSGTSAGTGSDWISSAINLGTHVVDAVGNVQLAKLLPQQQPQPQQQGMIPGLSKTESYMLLGGAGLLAVLIIFSMRK